MHESREDLREALFDLDRAKRAEQNLRRQYEQLLRGLEVLRRTDGNQEMFTELLELFREPLEFEQAFILVHHEPGTMRPIAATDQRLETIEWRAGDFTERALTGEPIAVFDVGLIPEWQQLPDSEIDIASALHIGIDTETTDALLVGTHSERGFFSPDHVEIGARLGMVATQAMVNRALRQRTESLEEIARTDALTGLHNRHYLQNRLEQEIDRVERYGGHLTVLYLDLDDFSTLNNTYGHQVGDHALQRVGQTLLEQTWESDICGRYGGDEFLVILPETSTDEAYSLGTRLAREIRDTTTEPSVTLDASIGLAELPDDDPDLATLVRRADEAMYTAKRSDESLVVWDPSCSGVLQAG
jgi:diguanylate cyclase (GGDEF)-like protein